MAEFQSAPVITDGRTGKPFPIPALIIVSIRARHH